MGQGVVRWCLQLEAKVPGPKSSSRLLHAGCRSCWKGGSWRTRNSSIRVVSATAGCKQTKGLCSQVHSFFVRIFKNLLSFRHRFGFFSAVASWHLVLLI